MRHDADVMLSLSRNGEKCQRCKINSVQVYVQRPGDTRVTRELCKRCVSDLVEKQFEVR